MPAIESADADVDDALRNALAVISRYLHFGRKTLEIGLIQLDGIACGSSHCFKISEVPNRGRFCRTAYLGRVGKSTALPTQLWAVVRVADEQSAAVRIRLRQAVNIVSGSTKAPAIFSLGYIFFTP